MTGHTSTLGPLPRPRLAHPILLIPAGGGPAATGHLLAAVAGKSSGRPGWWIVTVTVAVLILGLAVATVVARSVRAHRPRVGGSA